MDNHKISFNSQDCQKYRQDHEKSKDEKLVQDVSQSPPESKSTIPQPQPDDSSAVVRFWTKTLRTDKSDKEKNIDNFSDPSCR